MDISTSAIKKIAEKNELTLVVLFGSHATGHLHAGSDVDIGFSASRPLTLPHQLMLREDLAHALGRGDVELVNLRTIPPALMKNIADASRVLYQKNSSVFDLFSIYAHKLYIESATLRAMRAQYVRGHSSV